MKLALQDQDWRKVLIYLLLKFHKLRNQISVLLRCFSMIRQALLSQRLRRHLVHEALLRD